MIDDALSARVAELCATVMNIPTPAPDEDLVDAGYLDSLALVELLLEIEQTFAFTPPIDELDLEQLRTPRSIAAMVADSIGGEEGVA